MALIDKLGKGLDWVLNTGRTYGPYLAGLGLLIAGSYFVSTGGCDFRSYFLDKNKEQKEEQKEEPKKAKANLEMTIKKDDSWRELVDEKDQIWFQFYKGNGISAETFYGFESGKANHIVKSETLVAVKNAYRGQIGDRELTGPEILQVMRIIDNEKNARDVQIITEKEAIGSSDLTKGKTDEEIRSIFKIKCDAPFYILAGKDTESAYEDAVNAARAEYRAAEKLSTLTALGYEGARKKDEWNRKCEQERLQIEWNLRRQPRRR